MKLMLCLLSNHSIVKLKRLVECVLNEVEPADSIEVEPVIVINTQSDDYYKEVLQQNFPFPVIRTESNGKPGKGKNSCLSIFLNSDCDYLSQIDGDDVLYPTFLKSLENHVLQYKGIDVLGVIPCDVIERNENRAGHRFVLNENTHVSVWGVSLTSAREGENSGPKRNDHFFDTDKSITDNYIILQSRAAASVKIEEEIGYSEDQLYCFQYLAEHQKRNLAYFVTMSSDFQLYDRTTENSMQKIYNQDDWVDYIKNRVKQLIPEWEWRSCFSELPVIYQDLLMTQTEKERWLSGFYERNSDLFE